jgi:hypothetical protein
VKAIHRTDLDAIHVLAANTPVRDYKRHLSHHRPSVASR